MVHNFNLNSIGRDRQISELQDSQNYTEKICLKTKKKKTNKAKKKPNLYLSKLKLASLTFWQLASPVGRSLSVPGDLRSAWQRAPIGLSWVMCTTLTQSPSSMGKGALSTCFECCQIDFGMGCELGLIISYGPQNGD